MTLLWPCALAAAGFALGPRLRISIFHHAVADRGPRRNRCPRCARSLSPGRWRFWPTLPVTGRCPGCGARIGPPGLVIEFATALLLGALGARIAPGLVLAAAGWLAICAVPLASIDVAVHRLPDRLTIPAYLGTTAFLAAAAAVDGELGELVRALAGGAALAGCYLGLFVISPAGMGLGDSKMSASLGTVLAWFGWNTLLAGAAAGFILAAIYAATLLVLRRATRGQQMPFGPFMIAGSYLVMISYVTAGSHVL